MRKDEELHRLKNMPLEEKMLQSKKGLSCSLTMILFLLGVIPGLYYWFCGEIIHSYASVSPFWGFCLFVIYGIIITKVGDYIASLYWKEYNDEIINAKKEVQIILKEKKLPIDELNKLRLLYVENIIGTDEFTMGDYRFHSSIKCWGCGKEHGKEPPVIYVYKVSKNENWKERGIRYTKTFYNTVEIPLCRACFNRIFTNELIDIRENRMTDFINNIIVILITTLNYLGMLFFSLNDSSYSLYEIIFLPILGALFCLGLAYSLGQIIIAPLAIFISYIIRILLKRNKKLNRSTKWNFRDIPTIKRFYDNTQHR